MHNKVGAHDSCFDDGFGRVNLFELSIEGHAEPLGQNPQRKTVSDPGWRQSDWLHYLLAVWFSLQFMQPGKAWNGDLTGTFT
jgi:hypothetical protein